MPDQPTTAKPRKGALKDDALNLANLVTVARVALIPWILWLLEKGSPKSCYWAAWGYGIAAATDALDGWLARRRKEVSVLGQFLDPLADKLFVILILVYLISLDRVSVWLVMLIILRELSVTTLRTVAMSEGLVIAASQGGKEKTALQMVAILCLLVHYPYDLNFGFMRVHADLHKVGEITLFVSVLAALLSAGEYIGLFMQAVAVKEKRSQSDPP